MRYHWGLGVGHTYSHVRDSPAFQADSVRTIPQSLYPRCSTPNYDSMPATSASLVDTTPSHGFDDLSNDFSLSDLEWESPGDRLCSDAQNELCDIDASLFVTNCSVEVPGQFHDFDPSFSLADLDTLEWETADENGDSGASDADSDACHMYEMYGSDPGGEGLD